MLQVIFDVIIDVQQFEFTVYLNILTVTESFFYRIHSMLTFSKPIMSNDENVI